MIGPDELRELLHSHAATVEPVPHLAELGAALTNVERHRRNRVFVGTTIAAVAVTAAVAAVRTLEARPTRFDTAPATATRRVPVTASLASVPTTVAALPAATLPGADASTPGTPAPGTPVPTTPTQSAHRARRTASPGRRPRRARRPRRTCSPSGPRASRTCRPPTRRPSTTSASRHRARPSPRPPHTAPRRPRRARTRNGRCTSCSPTRPIGQRVKVVLSAPPLPALTFTFTHTAG